MLILLSNDIQLNPGPTPVNELPTFMTWNLNSHGKDNFQRLNLIEADNSIFDYDLISINETSLNDTVELPETLLDDYIFVHANNTANTRHGGVGLFYKKCLPVIVRNDLSFDESIVVELKFGRKTVFLQSYIEAPHLITPLLNFKHFCKTSTNYTAVLNLKIPLQCFLQVT